MTPLRDAIAGVLDRVTLSELTEKSHSPAATASAGNREQ
jgi:hypothetical protein